MALVTKNIYYIDNNGNYYTDANGNYYIAGTYTVIDGSTQELIWYKYTPYIYDNNNHKKYCAYIRKSDGTMQKMRTYINTLIDIAVAGIAIPGYSRSGTANLADKPSIIGQAIVGISKSSA